MCEPITGSGTKDDPWVLRTPPGQSEYLAYRLDDAVSFVHVARVTGTENPLPTLPAFAEFQRELARRCVEQPAPSGASVVGSYLSAG